MDERNADRSVSHRGLIINFHDIPAIQNLITEKIDLYSNMSKLDGRDLGIVRSMENNYPLGVAEGSLDISDLVIYDIEVGVDGHFSSEEGEWMTVAGEIQLSSLDVGKTYVDGIKNLKESIEKMTGSKWNLETDESGMTLQEESRLPGHIGITGIIDDGNGPPLVCVSVDGLPNDFFEGVAKFQELMSKTYDYLYGQNGFGSKYFILDVHPS